MGRRNEYWCWCSRRPVKLAELYAHFFSWRYGITSIIYSPYFRIKPWHLLIVASWTIFNDFIDYYYMMHPWVSRGLYPYIEHIGYFTFGLSLFSLLVVYLLAVRNKRFTLNLQ